MGRAGGWSADSAQELGAEGTPGRSGCGVGGGQGVVRVVSLGLRGHRPVGGDAESLGRHLPRGALGLRIGGGGGGGGGSGVKTDRGGSRTEVGQGLGPRLSRPHGHHFLPLGHLITPT